MDSAACLQHQCTAQQCIVLRCIGHSVDFGSFWPTPRLISDILRRKKLFFDRFGTVFGPQSRAKVGAMWLFRAISTVQISKPVDLEDFQNKKPALLHSAPDTWVRPALLSACPMLLCWHRCDTIDWQKAGQPTDERPSLVSATRRDPSRQCWHVRSSSSVADTCIS